MSPSKAVIFLLFSFILIRPGPAESQLWVGPTGTNTPRWATPEDFDGTFVFCRGYYEQNRSESGILGWYADYPGGDNNLMIRLGELTKIRIRRDATGNPVYVVVRLDSPLIFNCPVIFLSDVATMGLKNSEINNLRLYFEKGGFVWTDDFWGSRAWNNWEYQIRQVLPSEDYPMIEITAVHPIMHQLFSLFEVPQIPNIEFWYFNKGQQTSEQGEDSREVHFRGIRDKRGRLMVAITHNTDIGETWEWDQLDKEREYFYKFSPFGYELGINIFLYALTH